MSLFFSFFSLISMASNLNFVLFPNRKIKPEQRALLLSYAETEEDTPGTVDGIVSTGSGNILI